MSSARHQECVPTCTAEAAGSGIGTCRPCAEKEGQWEATRRPLTRQGPHRGRPIKFPGTYYGRKGQEPPPVPPRPPVDFRANLPARHGEVSRGLVLAKASVRKAAIPRPPPKVSPVPTLHRFLTPRRRLVTGQGQSSSTSQSSPQPEPLDYRTSSAASADTAMITVGRFQAGSTSRRKRFSMNCFTPSGWSRSVTRVDGILPVLLKDTFTQTAFSAAEAVFAGSFDDLPRILLIDGPQAFTGLDGDGPLSRL